ncbi:ABC transporter substrate-binding protein [Hydromonas duriensis]|uniref:Carbohydrate ABC transporter substrate-binding protein (CUT1 family) n=1 Tax=Hydromonas duriensis TaxID=1527608 RepID=A0A4V3DK98_9BURK|nr:ABC transporter substrate-binding protein [Hydromonas duriensis]TDR33180.1 carbohydrate ABC transporter substrate-binding protein (CUT1 family) [Hydromonas duriensis]
MKSNRFVKHWVAGVFAAFLLAACGGDKAKETSKASAASTATTGGVELTISCGSVGQDHDICQRNVDEWAAKTGNKVKLYSDPKDSSEKLALLRQQFGANASDIDVLMVDVVWPGILKDHLLDLKAAANGAEKDFFPAIVANDTIDGKLLAMPWFTDAGLLYYRKDLLEKHKEKVPTTWEELAATAKKIQDAERAAGNKDMQGYVFQAKASETLTCDALEWVASYNGGTIVDNTGKITINNAQAAKALDTAASWIGTIAPQGVLNYAEEEARGVFQNGNAVFMRNWPYAWSGAQSADSKIKDKVGVSPLPKGGVDGKSSATLGGWQLAVSKYSKHPKEAIDLVMFLTSKDIQKKRAIEGAYNPTIPALYADKDVLAKNPFFGDLLKVFDASVARPSTVTGAKYNEVSNAFWNAASSVLAKKSNGAAAVAKLEEDLNKISRGGKW